MAFLPGSYGGPQFNQQFFDDDGHPVSLGSLTFLVTGTVTPKDTYTTSERTTANANPLSLDAAGRCTFFLTSGGYDVVLKDANGTSIKTFLGVEDIGLTFLEGLGNTFAEGARNVTSPYSVLDTDNLVTVDSSAGAVTVNLPLAATRSTANNGNGLPLTIKNMGANTVAVTRSGADTLEGSLTVVTLPAAASPTFPSVRLVSDGVATWWVEASHGM